MQTYRVGGAVRDRLLGLPVKDIDRVVTGATVQDMLDAGYRQVGRDFPVFLHPQTHEEYALARTERKQGHGYTGFTVHADPTVTLEQDLQRRDLTINAMAEADDGTLIDPFGGQADLDARLLRHVSPAFAEDPLRVLRVARFAARFSPLGFTVAEETLALMKALVDAGELLHLVAERVWQETARALMESGSPVYFRVLRDCGALSVLLPELEALFGVPQSALSHPEIDTGEHTLMVLEAAVRLDASLPVRFAVLVHDIGKGLTAAEHLPSHPGHEQAGTALLAVLCERMRVPNDCASLARQVMLHHGDCHRLAQGNAESLLQLIESCDGLRKPGVFREFLLACEADHRGRLGFSDIPYPQRELAEQGLQLALSVSVTDVITRGLKGPAIGRALREKRLAALSALF